MLKTNAHFSTLAVDCYCYYGGEESAGVQACCDQWENAHAQGVKYSGDYDDKVRNCFNYKAFQYDTIANLSGSARIPMA
jgi:hypothetical protein